MTIVPRRLTYVWVALMAVTLVTWWLGPGHTFHRSAPQFAASAAVALAMVKVWLIGQDFMEIRGAHPALRAAFMLWVVVLGACTVVLTAS
jgi:hypothetical protein